jgi:hypothetical protein
MKKLDSVLFKKLGYLNEINRIYLHPLGLSLEVGEDNKIEVVDGREEKAGIVFNHNQIDEQFSSLSILLKEDYDTRCLYRLAKYGWKVQPLIN